MSDVTEFLVARGYRQEANEAGGIVCELPLEDGRAVRVDVSPNASSFAVRVVAKRGGITPVSYFQKREGTLVEREVVDMAVACEAWAVSREPRDGLSSADVACQIVQGHVGHSENGDLAGQVFSPFDHATGRDHDGAHWQDEGPAFVMNYLLQERFMNSSRDDLCFEQWKAEVYLNPDIPLGEESTPISRGP